MSALPIVGGLVALALAIVGAAALLVPDRLARAYGLPIDGDATRRFVTAMGIRDLVVAAILAATVYFHDVPLLIVVAIAGIVLSAADLAHAYHANAKRWRGEHATHVGRVVAFVLVLAMALFAFGM